MTSAMHTLDNSSLFQFRFWHTTNAVGAEIGVPGLDAPQTAQILVALLLPLGDQICVGDLLVGAIIVKFLRDRLTFVVQIVNVSRLLVMQFKYGP